MRSEGVVLTAAVLALALAASSSGAAEIRPLEAITSQAELDETVTALDAELFDAYNRCDLPAFRRLLAEDIEFYHDVGGATLGAEALTDSVRRNICGGDTVRELVSGSLKIYYMKGFGAVEIGEHRFLHPKSHTPTGEGKFINLWRYDKGAWKITRAISFDHRAAP
jgi:hypothetical protein